MTNEIKFCAEDHTYTYGDIPVPSVTTLIRLMADDPYEGVPKRNLQKAANYGDKIHSLVENYAMGIGLDPEKAEGFGGIALRRYAKLEKEYDIVITSCEQPVVYLDNENPLYCGMYDMLGVVGGKPTLIDIKTTAEVHIPQLEMQLSMYKAALEQMNNMEIQKTYCLWLPKKKLGQFIEIEIPKDFDPILEKARRAYEETRRDS
jgi:hypothetical protein